MKLSEYIHYYYGQKFLLSSRDKQTVKWSKPRVQKISSGIIDSVDNPDLDIKLILKPLGKITNLSSKDVHRLLKNGYDVFNLIDAGLALNYRELPEDILMLLDEEGSSTQKPKSIYPYILIAITLLIVTILYKGGIIPLPAAGILLLIAALQLAFDCRINKAMAEKE